MREIVIISGKGGTGKTSLTAAFAHLADNKVICDLDVDAPDLHLLLDPVHEKEVEFRAGNEARIVEDKCQQCGLCKEMCRYGAVIEHDDGRFSIDSLRCEGCKVCVTFCPDEAIEFPEKHCGQWFMSTTRFGPMVHARLFPGEENSGRLVALLKQQAKELAEQQGLDLILSDGAPGIGCPVISSLSGTHLAVLVTEPTPSGRHDLKRVAALCEHFRIPTSVIVNKFDLNLDETAAIEAYCREKNYPIIGRLPHDPVITEAMVRKRAVTELQDTELGTRIKQAWQEIEKRIA
jgi:MinD superfamily P-loop ATPase